MYNNYMHKVKTFFWFLKSTYKKYSVWKYEWIWKLWLIWIKLHLYAKNLLLTMLQYTKITFILKRKKQIKSAQTFMNVVIWQKKVYLSYILHTYFWPSSKLKKHFLDINHTNSMKCTKWFDGSLYYFNKWSFN